MINKKFLTYVAGILRGGYDSLIQQQSASSVRQRVSTVSGVSQNVRSSEFVTGNPTISLLSDLGDVWTVTVDDTGALICNKTIDSIRVQAKSSDYNANFIFQSIGPLHTIFKLCVNIDGSLFSLQVSNRVPVVDTSNYLLYSSTFAQYLLVVDDLGALFTIRQSD